MLKALILRKMPKPQNKAARDYGGSGGGEFPFPKKIAFVTKFSDSNKKGQQFKGPVGPEIRTHQKSLRQGPNGLRNRRNQNVPESGCSVPE